MTLTCEVQDVYTGAMIRSNNFGVVEVLRHVKGGRWDIRFLNTGTLTTCTKYFLSRGTVKDKNVPSYRGVGFIGYGVHSTKCKESDKHTAAYKAWGGMLDRVYDLKYHARHRYLNTEIQEDWHDFQVFASWFEANHRGEGNVELDKDILNPSGDKYGEDVCCLVPHAVNCLFTFRDKSRGKYAVGVSVTEGTMRYPRPYQAGMSDGTKAGAVYLGSYATELEAFSAYKVAKEAHIRSVAKEYRDLALISDKVYQALLDYKVLPYPESCRAGVTL